MRHVAYTLAYAAFYIAVLLTAVGHDFPPPGLQVSDDPSDSAVEPRLYARPSPLLMARRDRHPDRSRSRWAPYEPDELGVVAQIGRRRRNGWRSVSTASLSDVYWIRAVIYYGGRAARSRPARSYDQLYPLLDLVTSLDPQFKVAYRFGALFLSEPPPGGPGRPEQAIALLERGVEQRRGLGVLCRTSASCITGGGTITKAPPTGSGARPNGPGRRNG